MPKSTKQTRRRARAAKRARRGQARGVVNVTKSALNPIPQRYICKMKYADTFQITSGGGSLYRFNLNSIFDPNRTGTGHQPYGRDTLASLYNRYRVFKVAYALTWFNSTNAVKAAVCPANNEMGASTVSEIIENPMSKWGIQFPGGSQKTVSGVIDLPSLMGRTKAQYMADDRYQAEQTTSPGELAILNIFAQTLSDVAVTVDCAISLTYHVELFDRIPLGQS